MHRLPIATSPSSRNSLRFIRSYVWVTVPVLQLSKLYKRYGEVEVLRGVELSVDAGEVVVIMGPSGSGKTTLLHIAGTLEPPTSGQVIIGGEDASRLRGRELAHLRNRRLGFVFQFHYLLNELTALENVMLPALIAGTKKHQAQKRAEELLERLGLAHRAYNYPPQLSGGEQQRVAIARALINEPLIILADEPTGNLDNESAGEVIKLFSELNQERGSTFLIATHNPAFKSIASRCFLLRGGVLSEVPNG